jgi:hypothetical protein
MAQRVALDSRSTRVVYWRQAGPFGGRLDDHIIERQLRMGKVLPDPNFGFQAPHSMLPMTGNGIMFDTVIATSALECPSPFELPW